MFNPRKLYFERVGNSTECKFIRFEKEINNIGRSSSADVFFDTIKANTVSRLHSVIEFKNGRMYIQNLSKTNPTFLNSDKVIRKTEVEEGDLIGFGSKPNITYPHFHEDQIFIYECKSEIIKVPAVEESEDDDVIFVGEDKTGLIVKPKLEIVEPESKKVQERNVTKVERSIQTSPEIATTEKPPNKNGLIDSDNESDDMKHVDTIEKLKDDSDKEIFSDELSSMDEDDKPMKHVIKGVKIMLTKLTPFEVERLKVKQKLLDSGIDPSPSNGLSRSKWDTLEKSLEMREKIRKIADNESSDEDLVNIPISNASKKINNEIRKETNSCEGIIEKSDKKIEIDNKSDSSNHFDRIKNRKRRASVHEEEYSKVNKKQKIDCKPLETPKLETPKMETSKIPAKKFKFPDSDESDEKSRSSKKNNLTVEKRVDKPVSTKNRRTSFCEFNLNCPNVSFSVKLNKRRMSFCASSVNSEPKKSAPLIPAKPITAKKPIQRRQTICESRVTEFDMFSKASQLRLQKFGSTTTNVVNEEINQEKTVKVSEITNKNTKTKESTEIQKSTKKRRMSVSLEPKKSEKSESDVEIASSKIIQKENEKQSEALKTLEQTKSIETAVPNAIQPESNSQAQLTKNTALTQQEKSSKKSEENSNVADVISIKKMASKLATKVTQKSRQDFLTEIVARPLSKAQIASRRDSFINDPQPTTSKTTQPVSAFREKYYKPAEMSAQNSNKKNSQSIENTDEILSSLTEKIDMDIQLRQNTTEESENAYFEEEVECEPDSPVSSIEEIDLDSDDEEEQLKISSLLNLSSPMKDDPRGKTKWIKSGESLLEEGKNEEKIELRPFPESINYTTTITVIHEAPPRDVRSILKPPARKSEKSTNKRVSFNEFNLTDYRSYSIDDIPSNYLSTQQIAHVLPMTSMNRHPKYYEPMVCSEIMEWDPEWLKLGTALPNGWNLEQIEHTYENLEDYKRVIKIIMNVDLLRKLATKYKTGSTKDNDRKWNFMTIKDRKDEANHHMRLVLGSDSNEYKSGYLLILKVREMGDVSRSFRDIHFFGYITTANDVGEIKVETYCKVLKKEKAVLKATSVTHLRNNLKAFAVLQYIHDTPFLRLFLNPRLNKFNRNVEMSLLSFDSELLNKLCPEQRVVLNKLTIEFTKDDNEKIFFVNGAAGSGKTHLLITTALSMKHQLKERRQIIICTSLYSGIDHIAEVISSLSYSSRLNIVRFGYRQTFINDNIKKYWIQEQVQQRINTGVNKTAFEIKLEIIKDADIILTTCHDCYELVNFDVSCDTFFVDEANRCTDSELIFFMPLNIKRLVLFGDEYLLEPTQSRAYKEFSKLNISYFNRIINYYKSIDFVDAPVFTLTSQHRMSKELFEICNKYVYNNSFTFSPYSLKPFPNQTFKSFLVFSLKIMQSEFKNSRDSITIFCLKLCELLPKSLSIGIINGFVSRKHNLQSKLRNDHRIEFLTVENNHGVEKDVIIVTLRDHESNFMHCFNRLNVAMTRARKALYICSNQNIKQFNTPDDAEFFLKIRDEASDLGLCHTIHSFDKKRIFNLIMKCH